MHGGIDQLRYEKTGDPEIRSSTDVIVKLKAAAINRINLAIRAGPEYNCFRTGRTIV